MSESDDISEEEEEHNEEVVSRPGFIEGLTEFVDISFHPSDMYTLAVADMDGYCSIYKCTTGESTTEKTKLRISKKPCRCLTFSKDGNDVLVMNKDKTLQIICSITGSLKRKINEAHSASPYCICTIDKNLLATGDDNGTVKIWDLRKGNKAVMEDKTFDDYVSDIAVDDKCRLIFAVSGDGTMRTFNARQRKFIVQSQNEENDLLCAKVLKENNKLVVGTSDGPLLLYNWDEFAAPSDHFPGHPGSVDCMAKVSDDILCTASSDGMIRAVHILPNRFLGVVGDHKGMPVERVRSTFDGKFIASISHDPLVRFWSVDHLKEIEVSAREKAEKERKHEKMAKSGVEPGRREFFSDFDKDLTVPAYEDDSDETTSSSEGDE